MYPGDRSRPSGKNQDETSLYEAMGFIISKTSRQITTFKLTYYREWLDEIRPPSELEVPHPNHRATTFRQKTRDSNVMVHGDHVPSTSNLIKAFLQLLAIRFRQTFHYVSCPTMGFHGRLVSTTTSWEIFSGEGVYELCSEDGDMRDIKEDVGRISR